MPEDSSTDGATVGSPVTGQGTTDAAARPRSSSPVLALSAAAGVLVLALLVTLSIVLWPRDSSASEDTPMPVPSASTPTSTATPTSTPTASATPPALASLVLTENGLGDLRLGVDPAVTAGPASVAVHQILDCDGFEVAGWAANYADPQRPFGLFVPEGGGLNAVQVRSAEIPTDRGIRTGMTLDDVLAAYPEAAPLSVTGYMHRYGFTTSSGTWSVDVWMGDDQRDREVISILITGVADASLLGAPSYHAIGLSCL